MLPNSETKTHQRTELKIRLPEPKKSCFDTNTWALLNPDADEQQKIYFTAAVILSEGKIQMLAEPCPFEGVPDKTFFLLLPGKAPIEISGDLTKSSGDLCKGESLSDPFINFVEFKPSENKDLSVLSDIPIIGVIYARRNFGSQVRLKFSPVSESGRVESSKCKNLEIDASTQLIQLKSSLFTKEVNYFHSKSPKGSCLQNFWGVIGSDQKCEIMASSLGDCPQGGPWNDPGYGIILGVLRMEFPFAPATDFLILDSSFWENLGQTSFIPIKDSLPYIDKEIHFYTSEAVCDGT